MGCNSSTPNMVMANANPSEKIIHFSEDIRNDRHDDQKSNKSSTKDDNETIEKVLPACDKIGESIQLVRNNKSLIDVSHLQADNKDSYTNGQIMDRDNTHNKDSQVDDKLSTMEDVVEKVVELYISEADNTKDNAKTFTENSIALTKPEDQRSEKTEEVNDETSEPILQMEEETSEIILREEKLEDAISPSQSTSSRATRWEALADIAAELPPSLAVDPVTGQIYALSK